MLQSNTFSLFRKLEISCLHSLSFISLVVLILFITITNVYSAQVRLAWNQNTESDLAGYKLYSGPSSGNYDNVYVVGNQTSYTIQDLVEGQTYYFAVTAYDKSNNESGYSAEEVYTVLKRHNKPSIVTTITAGDIRSGQDDASTEEISIIDKQSMFKDKQELSNVSITPTETISEKNISNSKEKPVDGDKNLTKNNVLEILGKPDSIDKWSVMERWIYGTSYVEFENGIFVRCYEPYGKDILKKKLNK